MTPLARRAHVRSGADTGPMTAPLWLFGDQLGRHVHDTPEHADREVVLVESERVLRSRPFHRQKLHLVLSGMRHLAASLGDRARLLRVDTYREALAQVGRPVVVHQPTSHAAADLVARLHADGFFGVILRTMSPLAPYLFDVSISALNSACRSPLP